MAVGAVPDRCGWCEADSDLALLMRSRASVMNGPKGTRYRELPLWGDASQFLRAVEHAVRCFPRYHKYALGSELPLQAMQICRLVPRAAQSAETAQGERLVESLVWRVLIVQVGGRWEAYGADAESLRATARPPQAPLGGRSQPQPVAAGGALSQSAADGRATQPSPAQAPDQQARARTSARTDPPRHAQGNGQPIARGGLAAGLSWPSAYRLCLHRRLRLRQGPAQAAPIARLVRAGRNHCQHTGNRYQRSRSPTMNCLATSLLFLSLAVVSSLARAVDCQSNTPPSNPDSAYETHGDGTATDTRSGLMWKRCSEGRSWTGSTCSGNGSTHTWSQALALAEASTFAGYGDWRLPNINELTSLIEECRSSPAINNTLFPTTSSSSFWSGSPRSNDSSSVLYVTFEDGRVLSVFRSSNLPYVRLVRGGQ